MLKKEHKITYEEWKQKNFNENHLFIVCARARASRFVKTIKYTLLHIAIFSGRLDIVKHLIADKKADVDARGSDDKTALHLAAMNNKLEIVKVLLNAKADPLLKNKNGKTPRDLATDENVK
ncbi:ankyrin repeat domain-containing protein [Wolbachia endosymbiont of Cimex lectularius]|uniref:ankyrin repeat domain-containing protein n=1 Tax=Wolbachia endosymbiont of Cimex lectularius TaxID=246273 RepID=UPI00049B3D71|nr:ankyrin repeat domain-containing protein [Wolbachia endosymbiont of Cimex lectularius]BAP00269.1 ankyrin repeat-containing protein [Wolbachia endosymbiont of Cimex lectularius]